MDEFKKPTENNENFKVPFQDDEGLLGCIRRGGGTLLTLSVRSCSSLALSSWACRERSRALNII